MQQQHLDQHPGAGGVAEPGPGHAPERVVDRGERCQRRGPGPAQSRRAARPACAPAPPGSGPRPATGRRGPRPADGRRPASTGRRSRTWAAPSSTRTVRPIRLAGTEYRHCRTVTRACRSTLGVKVSQVGNASLGSGRSDARSSCPSWPTVWARLPIRRCSSLASAAASSSLSSADRVDFGHRDAVGAAEPATLTLHPTLLMGAVDAGLAVEGVEAVVGAERDPPVRLEPVPAGQHPRHRRLQVVVADVPPRHPAQLVERIHVALQERLLPLGAERPVHRPARRRQPEREQVHLRLHPAQQHPQVGEVDLALGTHRMVLRDERLRGRPARLRPHLRPPFRDVVADRRVRQPVRAVLVDQPGQHPPRGVPLLPRRVQIDPQHGVDQPA